MKRVTPKYGAFIGHLSSLSEDRSIRSADRAKLIIGQKPSTYWDVLFSSCATFFKCMQNDDLHILGALISLVRTVKETDQLSK